MNSPCLDIHGLRSMLRHAVGDMKDACSGTTMPEFCQHIGLPVPEEGGSKGERLQAAFDALPDE